MTTDELMHEFLRENPQHIAGTSSQATNQRTGVRESGRFLDSEGMRAFFCWLVSTGYRPRAVVERAWLIYHRAAPDDFPLPFPWKQS